MLSGMTRIIALPDSQNGFRGKEPLHDRMAWEGAVTVVAALAPDVVVLLGDMLDMAPFGKYRVGNDLLGATQRTLDETTWWLERLTDAAPGAEYIYLEGNHEVRLVHSLIDTNRELLSLRGMTVPALLGLEDFGIKYLSPYGSRWSRGGVVFTHGDKYSKWGGQTAAKYLQEYPSSVVYGHCHKAELAHRRWVDGTVHFAMSPGTLARCDGIVPGSVHPDWTQGVGVVDYLTGGREAVASIIPVGGKRIVIPGVGEVGVNVPKRKW